MKKFSNNYMFVIYLISFLDLFAVGLIFPILYPHLKSLGASTSFIGFYGTVYSGLQIFFGPLIGTWCDIRGCKTIFVICLSISSGCYFLCGCTNSLSTIFVLRCILGVTKHTQTLCRVLTMELVPKEMYSKTFSRSVSLGSLGFVIGPTIGGHLMMMENGFFYVSTLTALLFVVNIGMILIVPQTKDIELKTARTSSISTRQNDFHRLFLELKAAEWQKYWDVFLLRFFYGLSVSIFFTNHSLFLEETFNVDKVFIGYTISFSSAIGVLSGFLIRNVDNANAIRCAHVCYAMSLLSLNFTGSVYVYLILLIPFSILSTFLRIKTMELILTRADGKKGSLSGVCNSLTSLGRFVSPLTIAPAHNVIENCNIAPFLAFIPTFLASILCINTNFKEQTIKNKNL